MWPLCHNGAETPRSTAFTTSVNNSLTVLLSAQHKISRLLELGWCKNAAWTRLRFWIMGLSLTGVYHQDFGETTDLHQDVFGVDWDHSRCVWIQSIQDLHPIMCIMFCIVKSIKNWGAVTDTLATTKPLAAHLHELESPLMCCRSLQLLPDFLVNTICCLFPHKHLLLQSGMVVWSWHCVYKQRLTSAVI